MMACSYLSAGGLKSEPTSAACWSPPAMAGCHATDTRPVPMTPNPPMALPTGPMALPAGPMALPTGPMALPTGPMNLQSGPMALTLHESMGRPRTSMAVPGSTAPTSGQMGSSEGVSITNQPIGITSGSVGLPSAHLGQSSSTGPMALTSTQIVLPPFAQSLPLDLHKTLSQTGPPVSEPALDLSTSASAMTPALKSQPPTPDKNAE